MNPLLVTMALHVGWLAMLYVLLTIARAPSVWGVGGRSDGSNPWEDFEPRISANLRNQFEWPILFHVVCLLLLQDPTRLHPAHSSLAWVFIIGRVLHTGVQVLTVNVRLRGIVFTINFLAVIAMWGLLFVPDPGASSAP